MICNDVLAYLDDAECNEALANISRLTKSAAFLGLLTREDRGVYDPARTDPQQHWRDAAWYRRRLRRWCVTLGGGLYLNRPLADTLWQMDYGWH